MRGCRRSLRTLVIIFIFKHYFTVFKLIYSNDLWFYLQKQRHTIFLHTQRTPTVLRAVCTAKIINIGGPYRLQFPWTTKRVNTIQYIIITFVACVLFRFLSGLSRNVITEMEEFRWSHWYFIRPSRHYMAVENTYQFITYTARYVVMCSDPAPYYCNRETRESNTNQRALISCLTSIIPKCQIQFSLVVFDLKKNK